MPKPLIMPTDRGNISGRAPRFVETDPPAPTERLRQQEEERDERKKGFLGLLLAPLSCLLCCFGGGLACCRY